MGRLDIHWRRILPADFLQVRLRPKRSKNLENHVCVRVVVIVRDILCVRDHLIHSHIHQIHFLPEAFTQLAGGR
jgi:hypothetical protein